MACGRCDGKGEVIAWFKTATNIIMLVCKIGTGSPNAKDIVDARPRRVTCDACGGTGQ